ncbi:protein MEI2-like 4 isoform X1 [Iris pallida]|uniref:Protein MEI2-like 4 isoform X1 n=2 Tax=Iris pallida TaxID=29817 RepID=A0AAX6E2X8_IRIPA|nr:protein MEI2-like 4 isoform X1 [Iris pallida]
MPSDVIDQRHLSSFHKPSFPPSFFLKEVRLSSERQVGHWNSGSMPDHRGLETLLSGSKAACSSPVEKLRTAGGNFVDYSKLPQSYLLKGPTTNINIEHTLTGTESSSTQSVTTRKAPYQDSASQSTSYEQPAPLSMEVKSAGLNDIQHENGLISNSLSDIFNENVRLSSNDFLFGQSMDTMKLNYGDNEPFESLKEIEAQTIGNLLPDDDDLLAGAIHDFACAPQPSRTDYAEDDLFYSGGGMELEADDEFNRNRASDFRIGGDYGSQNRGLSNQFTGRFPCDEHPTRTLLVRNINGNVQDTDLRVLFEQYGDVLALYTSSKHHGFVMVSYCDIRAAENAARALQNKPFGCHRLDVRFCSPKDPLQNNINQGILVVFNLDSSISNEDIHKIFGAYGEIKEICETPNKHHQKIIEFYDVRAAEAALCALNRRDVAGKRINIEPYRHGGTSLVQQLPLELKERESGGSRQDGLHYKSPSELFVSSGLMTLGANTSNGFHNEAMQGIHSAVQMPKSSFMETKFQGTPSGASHNLSSTVSVTTVGNHSKSSGHGELSHSLGPVNLGLHSMANFQPHSLSEFHDGVVSAIPFNAANTMSAMTMNSSPTLAGGIDIRNSHGIGSGGISSHSHDYNEVAFGTSGNGSCSLHGHQYGWNNSNTYHHHSPSSMIWQNLPPFMSTQLLQQVHGRPRGLSHMSNPAVPLSHHHVGSAPSVNPSLWDRRHTYVGDCTATASRHQGSLGSVGFSGCSPLHPLEFASHNIFPHVTGNGIDHSIPSGHVGIPSPQQRGQIFRGRSSGNTTPTAYDGPSDRIRSRRNDASINQGDNKKQYELDIDRIVRGEDSRTTLMIKNIPNKYTSKMLLATIDEQHKGTYDFVYLPIDFKNKCNVGYAFINMIDPQHIIPFYQAFNGKKWEKFNSEKVASLAYARIQGKAALIAHFQNSSLMNEDKRCRPVIFHSDGPNAGDQEPFPVGVNIRSRRSRAAVENHRRSLSDSSNGDESSSSGSTKDE